MTGLRRSSTSDLMTRKSVWELGRLARSSLPSSYTMISFQFRFFSISLPSLVVARSARLAVPWGHHHYHHHHHHYHHHHLLQPLPVESVAAVHVDGAPDMTNVVSDERSTVEKKKVSVTMFAEKNIYMKYM